MENIINYSFCQALTAPAIVPPLRTSLLPAPSSVSLCPHLVTTYSLLSQWGCPACESHKGPERSRHTLQSSCPSNTLVIQGGGGGGGTELVVKSENVDLSRPLERRSGRGIAPDSLGLLFFQELWHILQRGVRVGGGNPPMRGFLIQFINKRGGKEKEVQTREEYVLLVRTPQGSYYTWNAWGEGPFQCDDSKHIQIQSLCRVLPRAFFFFPLSRYIKDKRVRSPKITPQLFPRACLVSGFHCCQCFSHGKTYTWLGWAV